MPVVQKNLGVAMKMAARSALVKLHCEAGLLFLRDKRAAPFHADAGIRVKGSSSFVSQEKKPSLAVKFNECTSGRHFHGHSKILLDNGHQDPTFLCDALAGELFRSAGVPAAKVTFAQVELNGQDAGLYVVEQAANHEFLAEFFQKTKGNLNEGAHQDVTDKLEK